MAKYSGPVPCLTVTGESAPTSGGAAEPTGPGCPLCQSTRRVLDPAIGESHCAECGLVFDSVPSLELPPPLVAEGRSDGSGRGIGPFQAPGAPKRSLGSTLSLTRDGQGRPLNWHRRYEFQHLKRVMQRQTARSVDGPLERTPARGEIAQCGERLALPPVVLGEAERIFSEAKVRGLYRGRSLAAAVGAAVYAACRRYAIPRTLAEVAKSLGARRAEVGRAFKVVHRGVDTPIPSVGTRAFLARYAEELALSSTVRGSVEAMLEEAYQSPELSGLSPHGLVAALIYLAAERNGERRSRAEVARVSAVTEVTLRSTSRLVERLFRRPAL
jgi:transcription initiation factor TFIIB